MQFSATLSLFYETAIREEGEDFIASLSETQFLGWLFSYLKTESTNEAFLVRSNVDFYVFSMLVNAHFIV